MIHELPIIKDPFWRTRCLGRACGLYYNLYPWRLVVKNREIAKHSIRWRDRVLHRLIRNETAITDCPNCERLILEDEQEAHRGID